MIVFSLQGSGSVSTAKNTLSPVADLALGGILLLLALVLASGRDQGLRERRRRKKEEKPQKEPRWRAFLSRGNARDTFVVGALLTLPGGSYLAGLDSIAKQDLSTVGTVLTVLLFNLIMLTLLELPLIGYALAPDWTPEGGRPRSRPGSRNAAGGFAIYGCAGVGAALVIRGLIELTSGELPGSDRQRVEQRQPVAQQARAEEMLAGVLLAAAAEALAQLGIGEHLGAAQRALLAGVDQEPGLAVLDLERNAADVAGDRRASLPECLGDGQAEALADRLLQDDVGLRLEGVDLDRSDVVEVVEDLDVRVRVRVLEGPLEELPALRDRRSPSSRPGRAGPRGSPP